MVTVVETVEEGERTMDSGDLPGVHLIEEGEIILLPGDLLQEEEGQEGKGQGQFRILLMLAQKGAMATALGERVSLLLG